MPTRLASARAALLIFAASCGVASAVACGSSSAGSSTSSSSGAPGFVPSDAQAEAAVNPANCVAPGTTSNANGVGGYCTAGGQECAGAVPDGAVVLCTADFNGPTNASFCTIACETDATCGGGAVCVTTLQGQACIPAACVALFADGGGAADGSPDADDVADAGDE